MSKFFRLISACLLLAILSACGQKGPLFLPEPPAQNQPTPEQAPDTDEEGN
ncbi:lipoprotein [Bowmanella sp. JS7-9]|uniref:Lipoprotein n=1 Tax=Pseudobowmanella zhangzhouensis TaxID=1537679 RepID=A0ABW1XJ26_9ALTE|nr:lipoprotein [Bowmanella sp. JS7-9]